MVNEPNATPRSSNFKRGGHGGSSSSGSHGANNKGGKNKKVKKMGGVLKRALKDGTMKKVSKK